MFARILCGADAPLRGGSKPMAFSALAESSRSTPGDKRGSTARFRELPSEIWVVPATLSLCCPQYRSHASVHILIPRRP